MTAPTERTNVRKLRHSIRKRVYKALMLTGGQPGLGKDQQILVVKTQIDLLTVALDRAKTLLEVVENRDFEAYKAAKDAKASMPDVEKIPASEEAAMTDLTFEQLVSKLGDDKDGEQPPF